MQNQINYWASLCESENGGNDVDDRLLRSREYYWKGVCLPYETRPGNVSDILVLEEEYPQSPLGENGVLMPAVNHPHRIVSLIREHESEVEYIDEGLITTYPLDRLITEYKKYYENNIQKEFKDLSIGQVYKNVQKKDKNLKVCEFTIWDKNNPPLIAFTFPFYSGNNDERIQFTEELVNKMFVCGYGLSYISQVADKFVIQPFKRKINLWMITFEAKFFEPKPELSDVLYHVTPSRYFEKVKQQGLIPRSKSDVFKYPERVYLFNKASIEDILKYGVKKVGLLKSHHPNTHVNDNGFYMFAIKKSKLESYQPYVDKKTVFYLDPCYDGGIVGIKKSKAIFTYNNIPRSLIDDTCWYYEIDSTSSTIKSSKTVSMK